MARTASLIRLLKRAFGLLIAVRGDVLGLDIESVYPQLEITESRHWQGVSHDVVKTAIAA